MCRPSANSCRASTSSAQFGIGAPRNTPAAVIATLNREINAGLADPEIKARLDQLDGVVTAATPAEFGKLLADETEKWAKVVKFAGIKRGLSKPEF